MRVDSILGTFELSTGDLVIDCLVSGYRKRYVEFLYAKDTRKLYTNEGIEITNQELLFQIRQYLATET